MRTALHTIAERKISQAIQEGKLHQPHWKNRPLPEDDMREVPPELRMAYRMLKNSGHVPEEVALKKEIQRIEDLLVDCPDEKTRVQQMKKLYFLKFKLDCRLQRPLRVDAESPYYDRVVAKITVSEK